MKQGPFQYSVHCGVEIGLFPVSALGKRLIGIHSCGNIHFDSQQCSLEITYINYFFCWLKAPKKIPKPKQFQKATKMLKPACSRTVPCSCEVLYQRWTTPNELTLSREWRMKKTLHSQSSGITGWLEKSVWDPKNASKTLGIQNWSSASAVPQACACSDQE